MKSCIKSVVLVATLALGTFGSGLSGVSAATVTPGTATVTAADTAFSWTVNFICSAALPCNGGNPGVTLQARAIFTLQAVTVVGSETFWDIGLVLRNNSFLSAGGFLTAMGFATDPDATLSGVWDANADGINWAGGPGSIPGFGTTELCVFDGNNCAAANEQDMDPAQQDRIGFTLTTGLVDTLTFSDFAVKWAGVGLDGGSSYDAGGTISVAPVPLPAAGGLLLAGLAGLALLNRKRKAA